MNRHIWWLALVSVFVGADACPAADCPQNDGLLTAGEWGGEHWLFDVASDGTVFLETDCARGTSTGPAFVTDGVVTFSAEMVSTQGDVQYPDGEPIPYQATFTGTVCWDTLTFTETVVGIEEDPDTVVETEGVVVLGEPPVLWDCQ